MAINEDVAVGSPKASSSSRWPVILGIAVILIAAIAVGIVAFHRDPDPIETVLDTFNALKNGNRVQWIQSLNAIDAQRALGAEADMEGPFKDSSIDRSSRTVSFGKGMITLLSFDRVCV